MEPYTILADHYDELTEQDCDYARYAEYLNGIAKRHNVREIADLACGTGKMTALLLQKGYALVGVDANEQMLSVARSKCRALFVKQDMRFLTLPHAMDMAVCVNDGVNYLSQAQLEPFFARVGQYLKQGAPFVFDISSEHKLRNVVGSNLFYWDGDNQTLFWQNTLRADRVEMDLTLFEREQELYRRSDERHVQFVHTVEQVTSALSQSGFDVVEVTDDYGKPLSKESLRQTFYAIKAQ